MEKVKLSRIEILKLQIHDYETAIKHFENAKKKLIEELKKETKV